MGLSHYALEKMGFRRRRDDESLQATFSSVHVFEVHGLASSKGLLLGSNGSVAGVSYRLALSETLNAAARLVASDDFTDDEPAWVAEHNCSPPYLLIHVGPTKSHEMTGDFLKEEHFGLHTYNAFIPVRKELRDIEAKVIPSVVSALSCTFGTLPNPVSFHQIGREVAGKTIDGRIVVDFGIEFRAEGRAGHVVPVLELQERFTRANALAARMSPEVSYFYNLAVKEDDPLKRFLYFFLTLERQTHAVFKATDHGPHIAELLDFPPRVRSTGALIFGTQRERWKSLHERFVWCALTVWTHLTDDDVEDFKKVKKARDQIAHGEIAAPSPEVVTLVERVASKLQLASHNGDA